MYASQDHFPLAITPWENTEAFVNEALPDSDDPEEDEECVDYRGATDRETLTEVIDTLRRLDEDVAPPPALTVPDSAAAALTPRSKAQLIPAPDVKCEKTGEGEAKEEIEATGQPSATTEDAPLATASSSAAVSSAPPPPPQRLTPRPQNRTPREAPKKQGARVLRLMHRVAR